MIAGAPDFRIVVPGAPRGVGRARTQVVRTKDGRTFGRPYTPATTRNEAMLIRQMAGDAMRLSGRERLLDCALEARVAAYVPIPVSFSKRKRAEAIAGMLYPTTKPDADNIIKFLDSLKSVVFTDDCRIVDIYGFKRYAEVPRLVIELRIMRQQDRDVVHVAA